MQLDDKVALITKYSAFEVQRENVRIKSRSVVLLAQCATKMDTYPVALV